MAHDVFISHSSVDKKAADAICHALEQSGVKCWIAPRDIKAGANYGGEIIRGIQGCSVFLLVFSREANASTAVAKEVERAVLGYKKTVIPFRIEDVAMSADLEFFLTDVHWLDAFPDDTVFENLVTAVKNALGMNIAAEPAIGAAEPPPFVPQPALKKPWGKKQKIIVRSAIVAACVAIVLFMILGPPGQDTMLVDPATDMAESEADTSSVQIQGLSEDQQMILDTLTQKFPEALPGLASRVLDDKVFLAAAGKASYIDPVFDVSGLEITLLLPDVRAESLDKLGIEQYTPGSDAQAYIRENYAKLRGMDTPDRIEMPVKFYFEKTIEGGETLDWELDSLMWGLNDYMNVFTPHTEQYMADIGFNDAAAELLMPYDGVLNDDYISNLADALSFKGVDIYGQLVVDRVKIESVLKDRLAGIWVYDSVSVANKSNSIPYQPFTKARSLSGLVFFSQVREGLEAQFMSGSKTKPSSLEELDKVFLEASREMAEGILDSQTAKDQGLVSELEYSFAWAALGDEGIAASPELVEYIRTLMNSYDFHLMFIV